MKVRHLRAHERLLFHTPRRQVVQPFNAVNASDQRSVMGLCLGTRTFMMLQAIR